MLPEQSAQFERLPPHSIEAEMCLIGSLLLCASDRVLFSTVRATVDREAFYLTDHQIIFDVLIQMFDANRAIDAITVRESLRRKNLYEEIGGDAYLGKILNAVPSFAHAEHYARIVAGKSKLRQMIALGNEMLKIAYEPSDADDDNEQANELMTATATKLAGIITQGRTDKIYRMSDVLPEVLAARQQGDAIHHPTRIRELDNLISGLGYGEKTIIGGKASMGKSAVIKKLIRGLIGDGIPVGYVNIEETRHKIVANLLSGESGVPNNRIQHATASQEEWDEIERAAGTLNDLPLRMVDSARKISAILSMVNLLVMKEGCRAIFIDHLHIIDTEARKNENREREISRISQDLKWAWKELGVIGVEAAQLNRSGGRDRPTMDHLRDSGSLGQDADTVILLHREDYYNRTESSYRPDHVLELIVAKNKSGASGTVPVFYDDARYMIRDFHVVSEAADMHMVEGMFR